MYVWMDGGADTWNMLVPQECDLYQEYTDIRMDIAMNPEELLHIDVSGQSCSKFGVHHRLTILKELYDAGEASFVTNIGSLVQPTVGQNLSEGAERCFALESHSDQTREAWTLRCQDMGSAAMGVGGRIADALALHQHTSSISMVGADLWSQGFTVGQESVAFIDGVSDYEPLRGIIRNITRIQYDNVYANAYTELFLESIDIVEHMSVTLAGVELHTNFRLWSPFAVQMENVAQLITVRERRHVERDLFFVTCDGFDHHSNVKSSLSDRFYHLSAGLTDFVNEMRSQSLWSNVVVISGSEFGRSLASNGGGSEHGWAGNHFVAGGAVKGGMMLNKYPESLAPGNPQDMGYGRLVPEFPWESMLVPVAQWLGVDEESLAVTFPNLHNFGTEQIISMDLMFSA